MLTLARWLYQLTLAYGVFGLAGGAFLESLGVPTAAAVIDLTAGMLILNERTTFLEAVLVANTGLVIGSLVSYFLGRTGSSLLARTRSNRRDGRQEKGAGAAWLKKHGPKAIFFAQLFGPTRTRISYPAGAMRMAIKKFTLYTALGGAVYCTIIIAASLFLTDFIRHRIDVEASLRMLGRGWAPLIAAIVLVWVAAHAIRQRRLRLDLAPAKQPR